MLPLCHMAQPQELLFDSHLGLPGRAASLIGGKNATICIQLAGKVLLGSPAHTEGLYMPHKHLTCLSDRNPVSSSQQRLPMLADRCCLCCWVPAALLSSHSLG